MRKLYLILMSVISLFIISCGDESLLESMGDEDSDAAREVSLKEAMNTGDFNYVIGELENADPSNSDYSNLMLRERYTLATAWLGKSGFNVLDNIEQFTSGDTDTAAFLTATQTKAELNYEEIEANRTYYKQVTAMFQNSANVGSKEDKSMILAAGFASALNTVMGTYGVAAKFLGEIDLTKKDELSDKLTQMLSDEGAKDELITLVLEEISTDELEAVVNMIDDQSVKDTFNEFKDEIDAIQQKHKSAQDNEAREQLVDFLNNALSKS